MTHSSRVRRTRTAPGRTPDAWRVEPEHRVVSDAWIKALGDLSAAAAAQRDDARLAVLDEALRSMVQSCPPSERLLQLIRELEDPTESGPV